MKRSTARIFGLFLLTELLRNSNTGVSTLLSMAGWLTFSFFALDWARAGRKWAGTLRDLARMSLLAAISTAVLFLYYERSRTLEAGVHVDSVYTYRGLTWFFELRNPITFAGATPSYHQFPMSLLTHLPALAIGFGRLGAFSMHFGIMVQVAFLFAVVATIFLPGRLTLQALAVALASAVFSNRMLVLSYDKVGYTIPAICLGLMFLVVVDSESVPDPNRIVGGLLSLSLLHHYTGWAFVLPACGVWLLTSRRPLRRTWTFLAQNSVLVVVAILLSVTLAVHPELLIKRVRDVTVQSQAGTLHLASKVRQNWPYLVSFFPGVWFRTFFIDSPGSWHLLNAPPLGGLVVPLVAGTWLLSSWSLPGRRARCLLYLACFTALLVGLAVLQHLLTDFSDYRDFVPIFALMTAGLLFVFRAPKLRPKLRLLALTYAIAFGLYNFVDLAALHGKVHATSDYAHLSQQTMESLVRYLKRHRPAEIGVARIYAVLDSFFPLDTFYLDDARRYGAPMGRVDVKGFCADPRGTVQRLSEVGCEPFLVVVHADHCTGGHIAAADRTGPRVVGQLYGSTCGRPAGSGVDRLMLDIPVDSGG